MQFVAFERAKQGTGASRRLRNSGRTPCIVYGGSAEPVTAEVDHNTLWHALKKEAFHSSVLDMELAGQTHKVVLRNFEGFITTYEEPLDYARPNPALTDPFKDAEIQGQEGVFSLLQGEKMVIKPEGFDALRLRGGKQHRLRQDEKKWKALGIGDPEQGADTPPGPTD